ncbi:hypothetical protein BDY19DRAFT_418447 [Irpex rosettiformis]|uniref:Uncharacterized protein n=1 Tax=Irpex rosettiformis TaxID=378272 RepID=A0ACB8UG53_9APHY|nr:hypothetical protein BDY19DRAFT_418447 [Irpex rosettiformis]
MSAGVCGKNATRRLGQDNFRLKPKQFCPLDSVVNEQRRHGIQALKTVVTSQGLGNFIQDPPAASRHWCALGFSPLPSFSIGSIGYTTQARAHEDEKNLKYTPDGRHGVDHRMITYSTERLLQMSGEQYGRRQTPPPAGVCMGFVARDIETFSFSPLQARTTIPLTI